MKHNWEKSLEVILHHEGGYVNHPKDPGGETNMGVTKRVYEDFGGTKDMKELTREDVEPIYKKNYWDRVKGDDLPEGLDLCIFDFAVNAGPGRAAKFIQRLVNTTVDGGIGPNTLKCINDHVEHYGVSTTIDQYQSERQNYYEGLSTFETFGRGWTRRVDEVTEKAKEWIQ